MYSAAMVQAGWVFGLISIGLASSLSWYCGVLLTRCQVDGLHTERYGQSLISLKNGSDIEYEERKAGVIPSYPRIGYVALGTFVADDSVQELNGSVHALGADTSTTIMPLSAGQLAKAYVTIAFSYGGACVFPELVRVMKYPNKFKYGLGYATIVATMVYLIISCVSYGIYGQYIATKTSIVNVLPDAWPTKVISVMLLIHLLSAFLILLNPVFRELERLFRIEPKASCETNDGEKQKAKTHKREYIGRFLIRTILIAICYFVAIIIPCFGDWMALIGATTITLSSFVLPCMFYISIFWPRSWFRPQFIFKTREDKVTDDNTITEIENNGKVTKMSTSTADGYNGTMSLNKTEKAKEAASGTAVLATIDTVATGDYSNQREVNRVELVFVLAVFCFSSFVGVVGTIQSIQAIANDL
eukprot:Awhi_evm1s1508